MRPSLTNRLRIGFAVLVGLLVAVSVLGVGRLFQIRQDFEDRSAEYFEISLQTERVRSAFVLQQSALTEGPPAARAERRAGFAQARGASTTATETTRLTRRGRAHHPGRTG